ncbi:hypothetical protein MG293_006076 [Ovis ammon polii]|uniref:Uncharacterized protein n=1 Tax=Ovis ammon polii TaxID=230172 RepID=A0AAD4YDH9_OVIAM|nr:hypothetical protein MG293_006076 [Ovis ammon polii]
MRQRPSLCSEPPRNQAALWGSCYPMSLPLAPRSATQLLAAPVTSRKVALIDVVWPDCSSGAPGSLVSMATMQKHHTWRGHEVFPSSADWSCCPFKARLSGCLFLPASPFDYACPPVALTEFLKRWQERFMESWPPCMPVNITHDTKPCWHASYGQA